VNNKKRSGDKAFESYGGFAIAKLAKGKYYKPERTLWELRTQPIPQVVLEDDGKTIGYLTGYSMYNQLGLTTQISNTIQISS
jgi:hypothetical protein